MDVKWSLALAVVIAASGGRARGGETPLADAAENGDREAIATLIGRGRDVNESQVDGMTALHWAVYRDDFDTVKRLIDAGADVTVANRYGVPPLSTACVNGNAEVVESLLAAGADANATLRGDETALMTAARTGRAGPVKALLARGADVNAKDRRGQTALIWAAAEGHADVVRLLIDAGADLRGRVSSGMTALHFAAREGRSDVVRTLLQAGAKVDSETEPGKKAPSRAPARGTSPLLLAVENGHFELAVLLLDAGADPNDRRSGVTPLHTLTWVRKPRRGDDEDGNPPPIGSGRLGSLAFARELVERGADVNARLDRGRSGGGNLGRPGATAFLLAAETADVPLMRLLVESGADPSIPNDEASTPLMAAAGLGSPATGDEAATEAEAVEAVEYVLSLGGDVNAVDENGETAMHGAAYKNAPLVVGLLAKSGAKPEIWNRPNKYGWTPVEIAEGHRHGNFKPSPETAAALRTAGG